MFLFLKRSELISRIWEISISFSFLNQQLKVLHSVHLSKRYFLVNLHSYSNNGLQLWFITFKYFYSNSFIEKYFWEFLFTKSIAVLSTQYWWFLSFSLNDHFSFCSIIFPVECLWDCEGDFEISLSCFLAFLICFLSGFKSKEELLSESSSEVHPESSDSSF